MKTRPKPNMPNSFINYQIGVETDASEGMTRGKQKIEAQKKNAERNQKGKGSQLEARAVGLKTSCPICKVQLANHKQLVDHFASKHPKEKPPAEESM